MEAQTMPGPNGTPAHFPSLGHATVAPSSPVRLLGIVLRGLAVVLTLVATIVMGVAKQSVVVPAIDDYSGEIVDVEKTAKSTDFPALVYFIAANAIAFLFSSLSLAIWISNRSSSGNCLPLLSMADMVAVALLFSCNGAAATITMLGKKGMINYNWPKFCYLAGKFCSHLTASVVLSMIACLVYLLLHLLSVLGSLKKPQQLK